MQLNILTGFMMADLSTFPSVQVLKYEVSRDFPVDTYTVNTLVKKKEIV